MISFASYCTISTCNSQLGVLSPQSSKDCHFSQHKLTRRPTSYNSSQVKHLILNYTVLLPFWLGAYGCLPSNLDEGMILLGVQLSTAAVENFEITLADHAVSATISCGNHCTISMCKIYLGVLSPRHSKIG